MALESKRPFGNLYTLDDYTFLRNRNLDMGRTRTPEEDALTSVLLRQIYTEISMENENEHSRLIKEIERKDGIEVKVSSGRIPNKLFVLSAAPIDFAVDQGERRTSVIFQPDSRIRYDPYYFYDLFFDEIPAALYGRGKDAPTISHIKESTLVSVVTKDKSERPFDLQKASEKQEFEKIMENPDRINYVKFTCDGEGISYSLVLPNPEFSDGKYVQFSFPSKIPITEDILSLFLRMHKDGWKLDEGNESYTKSFASAINRIREDLRVK
jgi:hypothetical protein